MREVAVELVFDARGDFLEAQGAQFGHHAAGFQGGCQFFRGCGQKNFGTGADGFGEGGPALGAGGVGGGIAAVPPDEKEVGIGGPGDLLWAVEGFELIEEIGERD